MAAVDRIDVAEVIDRRTVSWYQIGIIILCMSVSLCDGFDLQAISYIGASIREEFHLPLAAMGPLFSAGLVGMMIGNLVLGPLADLIGRRVVIIGSVFIFAFFTLVTALASSVDEIMILRVLAGIGIGSVLGNGPAMIVELCPRRRQKTILALSSLGFVGGATLAGVASALLLPSFAWRAIFLVGGLVPLVLGCLLFAWLPELLRFLAIRASRVAGGTRARARLVASLRHIDPGLDIDAHTQFVSHEGEGKGIPVKHLLTERRAYVTIPLWVISFFVLLDLFLLVNWMPVLARTAGSSLRQAVLLPTFFQAGGVCGGMLAGYLMDRARNFYLVNAGYAALAGLSIALMAMAGLNPALILPACFAAGFGTIGSQGCAVAAAATAYPTYARSSGTGWVFGIGRFGSFVGPLLGGTLALLHWNIASLFYVAIVPMAVALAAALFLAYVARPALHRDSAAPEPAFAIPGKR